MSKRFLVLGFALLILIGSLLACGESSNTNTGTATNNTPAGNTPAATQAPAQHFKVGQVVKVGDTWQICKIARAKSTPAR